MALGWRHTVARDAAEEFGGHGKRNTSFQLKSEASFNKSSSSHLFQRNCYPPAANLKISLFSRCGLVFQNSSMHGGVIEPLGLQQERALGRCIWLDFQFVERLNHRSLAVLIESLEVHNISSHGGTTQMYSLPALLAFPSLFVV